MNLLCLYTPALTYTLWICCTFNFISLVAMVFWLQQLQQQWWSISVSYLLEFSDVACTAANALTNQNATNVLSSAKHRRWCQEQAFKSRSVRWWAIRLEGRLRFMYVKSVWKMLMTEWILRTYKTYKNKIKSTFKWKVPFTVIRHCC